MDKEQIKAMLLDIVDNMEHDERWPSHDDMKREWLFAVSDSATELAREVPY